MASKRSIRVKVAKKLNLSAKEAKALKEAYQTCTAQVLKSTKRTELIQIETNDPVVAGARRPGKAKPKKKVSGKK